MSGRHGSTLTCTCCRSVCRESSSGQHRNSSTWGDRRPSDTEDRQRHKEFNTVPIFHLLSLLQMNVSAWDIHLIKRFFSWNTLNLWGCFDAQGKYLVRWSFYFRLTSFWRSVWFLLMMSLSWNVCAASWQYELSPQILKLQSFWILKKRKAMILYLNLQVDAFHLNQIFYSTVFVSLDFILKEILRTHQSVSIAQFLSFPVLMGPVRLFGSLQGFNACTQTQEVNLM